MSKAAQEADILISDNEDSEDDQVHFINLVNFHVLLMDDDDLFFHINLI